MKYYSYSESLGSRYRKPARARSPLVAREPVPTTISLLDVLLSIWIAEAILESDPRAGLRLRRSAPKRRAADVEQSAAWFQPDAS